LTADAEQMFDFMLRPPQAIENLVAEASEVYDFMHTDEPRDRLHYEIARDVQDLERELAASVTDFYDHIQFVRDIRERTTRLAGKDGSRRSEFIVTDPLSDLGLIRWGGDLKEKELRRTARIIEGLFSADLVERMRAASELTRATTDRLDESKCLSLCGVLWMLSLFERVILTINHYDRNLRPGGIEASLAIMRTAARARIGPPFSTPEKTDLMTNLELEVAKVQDLKKRARLHIGLAYTAYCISQVDKEHLARPARLKKKEDPAAQSPWAMRCYEYGERAIRLTETADDRRGLAFALNHCAYVGTVMQLAPERTAEYVRRLKELEDAYVIEDDRRISLWHYRFADTIAVTEYRAAYTKWGKSLEETDPTTLAELRRETCSHIRAAREKLASAPPKFGDPEILEHIEEIERLNDQAGCDSIC
jgi:hypothetical protein